MNYMIYPGLKKIKQFTDPEKMITNICQYFGVTIEQIRKRNRKREVVIARQMCMYFVRKYTHLTFKMIADIFGFDHSTIIYSINLIDGFLYIKDEYFVKVVDDLESIL